MKILFVSANGVQDSDYGGPKGSIRNYKALTGLGKVDVFTIKKESTIKSGISLLSGLYPPISHKNIKELKELSKNNYDIVFFDGSIFGNLSELFPGSKIVVFYHNCEHDYNQVRFGEGRSIKKTIYQYLVDRNEGYLTKNADYRITFSKRDAERIKEVYGVEAEARAPLGIDDKYTGKLPDENIDDCCLLLGPVCTANLEGYEWFIKNVSPFLKCKTVIAGRGFEAYKDAYETTKVQVVGYVEDLEERYANSSCVAIPLFSGGGMKVKTVEALMFGKTIFGTDEAFSGFEYDMSDCSYICNTAEEFVGQINRFMDSLKPKYNAKSRAIYESKYSVESTSKIFVEMVSALGMEDNK